MTELQDKRLALGKDIREIAEDTKIRMSFLKAIEEHNFEKLPVEVYTKAYIKEYARYLGVSPDNTLLAYERYLHDKNQLKNTNISNLKASNNTDDILDKQQTNKINEQKQVALKSTNAIFNTPLFKLTIVIIIMIFSGYMFLSYQARHNGVKEVVEYNPPLPTATSNEVLNPINETDTKIVNEQPHAVVTKNEEKVTEDAMQPFKHSLNIIAVEKVWIQIIIDNNEKKDITLNAGQNLTYKANKSFRLLIGNAGGVKIKFDNKILENLGDSGKVIKITLPEPSSNT